MWRDPLDELIEDLEGAVPPQPQVVNEMPSVTDFQYFMAYMESGRTPPPGEIAERVERAKRCLDARAARWRAQQAASPSQPSADRSVEATPQCTCGAEARGDHTHDCPLAYD